MAEQWWKALWVALPVAFAAAVTLFAGPRMDLQLLCYGVAALAAGFGVWATNARSHRREREDAERERWESFMAEFGEFRAISERADRVQLRNNLVSMHREWAEERGFITLEALEYVDNTYEIYHDLGGNGSGTRLWEDLHELPIREGR